MSERRAEYDAQVLAIIEALRGQLGPPPHDRSRIAQLAEQWRRTQLFPPAPAQVARALALMSKTLPDSLHDRTGA